MDVVELIKREHAKTSNLFDKLAETSTGAVKTRERLFGQLKTGIEVHGKVIQDLVYPLLRKQEETRDLIPDLKERNEVKRQLADLERTPKDDEEFLAKVKALKRVVEQHLRTEQRQIFPAIKRTIGGEEADELAQRIAAETREEMKEANGQDDASSTNGRGHPEDDRHRDAVEHPARTVSHGAQRVAEEGVETAEESVAATTSSARRMTETAARQITSTAQSVRGATQTYAEAGQRPAEGLRIPAAVPSAAMNALSEVHRAWADLFNQSLTRNAQTAQEMFRCSNPQELAAAHRQFLYETMSGLLETNLRVLQATRRLTEDALRPIEQEVARRRIEERRRDRGRSEAAAAAAPAPLYDVRSAW